MSASQVLSGSPAAVDLVASAGQTASFNNATITGVKSLSGGDAAGLAITGFSAAGVDLVASAGNVAIVSALTPPVVFSGAGTVLRTAGAAAGTFTLGKNAAGAVGVATYLPIAVGNPPVNYWIPVLATDPQTT